MAEFYSVEHILTFAIHLEQAAQEYYRHLSKTTHSPSVTRFLETLIKEEKMHEERLMQLLEDEGGALTQSISVKDVEGYIQAVKTPEEMDYKQAVKLAKDKEKSSQMLYSVLAGAMDDDALAHLFFQLADQEHKHWQFFDRIYHDICLREN